jgi:hypothetical protein
MMKTKTFIGDCVMSKKMKLNINDLKVVSFVTSLKDEEKGKAKGGWTGYCWKTWPPECKTDEPCGPDSEFC